jgi:hypothetical protein
MKKKKRLPRRRPHPPVRYPIATVAHYGPDDQNVIKIAVGIVESEGAEPIMDRWIGPERYSTSSKTIVPSTRPPISASCGSW